MNNQYKPNDKVRIVKASMPSYWYSKNIGEVFTVLEVLDMEGRVKIKEDPICYLRLEDIEHYDIQPEEQVTITTTYGELAKVYAILGRVRSVDCISNPHSLWNISMNLLDPNAVKRNSFPQYKSMLDDSQVLGYSSYQKEWLEHLFEESRVQREIRELEETITKAQEQLKTLKTNLK